MDVDSAVERFEVPIGYFEKQSLASSHTARVSREGRQQIKLDWCQYQRLITDSALRVSMSTQISPTTSGSCRGASRSAP